MGRETQAEKTLTAAGPGNVALLPELIERLAGPSARIVVVVSGGFSQREWRNSILAGLRPLTWSLFIHRGETTPASIARPGSVPALGAGSCRGRRGRGNGAGRSQGGQWVCLSI